MALADNLISCWELEEASGTRVDAVVASANDLTDNNTVTQAAGKVGNAAVFTAANSESLSRASNSTLQVTGSFSFGTWVKLTTTAGTQALVGKWNVTGAIFEYILLYITGYGFYFIVRNTANTVSHLVLSSFGVGTTGVWYYVVGVYDAAGPTVNISVNGGAFSSAAGPATPRSSTADFRLGVRDPNDSSFLNATLDQVVFFKRALSVAVDIAALYNGGAGLSYAAMTAGGFVPYPISRDRLNGGLAA